MEHAGTPCENGWTSLTSEVAQWRRTDRNCTGGEGRKWMVQSAKTWILPAQIHRFDHEQEEKLTLLR